MSRESRPLAIDDAFTREAPARMVDNSLSGARFAQELDALIADGAARREGSGASAAGGGTSARSSDVEASEDVL